MDKRDDAMLPSEGLIELCNVTKVFGKTVAVDNLSLAVEAGERVALLGPSGCGKTTTLRLIAGFEKPDGGVISIGDGMVADPGAGKWVPPERRGVGMVFQDYALFPHLTVAGNVGFGLTRKGERQSRRGERPKDQASRGGKSILEGFAPADTTERVPPREERVREMLQLVGLCGLEGRHPHELSGGQQQRVALARALAPNPIVLLLDEPFSNLDAELRSQMRDEVVHILAQLGTTAVLVTHDQQEAFAFADRVAVLNQGRLEQFDTPWNLYHHPATKFVAGFVGQANFLPAMVQNGGLFTELGLLPLSTGLPNGSRLEVLLRPESVAVEADPDSAVLVESTQFRGADVICVLRLPSGRLIRALAPIGHPATLLLRRGTKVRASVASPSLVAFLQEQAIPVALAERPV